MGLSLLHFVLKMEKGDAYKQGDWTMFKHIMQLCKR